VEKPGETAHATQNLCAIPPFFENTRCLAVIMGESGYLGRDSGLGGTAKFAVSSTIHEGFLGGGKNVAPDLDSGLIMGDFVF
jgi:hypothetical protein